MTDVIAQLRLLAEFTLELTKANFGPLVAVVSAVIALTQARSAKHSLHQARLLKLFGSFDVASKTVIENPDFLYSVHGLSRDGVSEEEASNIAYLSMLLDSFQHYYGEKYNNDFTKMIKEMKVIRLS